jgi:CDP-glycerol glycerophosphotransferase (TagB/SpsB family)
MYLFVVKQNILFVSINNRSSAQILKIIILDEFNFKYHPIVISWTEFNEKMPIGYDLRTDFMNYNIDYYRISSFKTYDSKKILGKLDVKCVIVFNDQAFIERSFIEGAKQLNIKSLYLQDSNWADKDDLNLKFKLKQYIRVIRTFSFFYHRIKFFIHTSIDQNRKIKSMKKALTDVMFSVKNVETRGLHNADLILTTGMLEYQLLLKYGIHAHKIRVVGNPRFYNDRSHKDIRLDIAKNYPNFDLNKKRTLMIATSSHENHGLWTSTQVKYFIRKVNKIIQHFSTNTNIIIKFHPSNNLNQWMPYFIQTNYLNFIQNENITELIKISDIILAVQSTIIIESIIYHKPIILLNFFRELIPFPFVKQGIALEAFSVQSTIQFVEEIWNNYKFKNQLLEKCRQKAYDIAYKNDGKAANRILSAINDLI